jgi:hypothetical protein
MKKACSFILIIGFFQLASSLHLTRRSFFLNSAALSGIVYVASPTVTHAADGAELTFITSKSGIQWADAKIGTGPEPTAGANVAIDYILSTTGARYGAKIYSTADKGAPYRWRLGDGSTILGVEEAILGSDGIPAMRPGGIRRVIIPSSLAYSSLGSNTSCKGTGPIPPVPEAFEEFQRFKNIYCNPNRVYQPEVVMDIKLYGKR